MIISFNTLKSDIQRHLSVIGKRQYSKDGQNMFSNITVSSEEKAIFDQYIKSGAQTIEAMLRPLVTSFSTSSTDITLILTNTRGSQDFDSRCKEMATSFLIAYVLNEFLGMNYPDLAKKYSDEASTNMQSLILYAFQKNEPSHSSASYNDINGTTL